MLAWPAPKPAATPSRSPRWRPGLPGRSAPWRCSARASRNRSPAGKSPSCTAARTAAVTPLRSRTGRRAVLVLMFLTPHIRGSRARQGNRHKARSPRIPRKCNNEKQFAA
jgi:hypothetical protein